MIGPGENGAKICDLNTFSKRMLVVGLANISLDYLEFLKFLVVVNVHRYN